MTMKSTIGSIKGTPIYMATEIWKKGEYSESSDVYAFGFFVYELVTNEKPFDHCNYFQIILKVQKGDRTEFKKTIDMFLKN